MTEFFTSFWKDDSGISSVEYALLLAFVAAGVITAASTLSTAVTTQMNDASTCLNGGACN